MTMLVLAGTALALWLAVLLVPWQPWRMRETLEPAEHFAQSTGADISVLIPARNEADTLVRTLPALAGQGDGLTLIVVDDESTDGTRECVARMNLPGLRLIDGKPLPAGWSGKLWALEQARLVATTPLVLLLDADIELAPGMLAALRQPLDDAQRDLVSVMARLRMQSFWERLLLPAFVYFFKLIYPFALSNRLGTPIAAAAGGCVLVRRDLLDRIGGFGALRAAIIDDCTLARCVKRAGGRTWTGVTRGAVSLRAYDTLQPIWDMVARTAYTQLRYSPLLLLVCTALLVIAYVAPVLALCGSDPWATFAGLLACLAMAVGYVPTLRYYRLSPLWALALPIIATLYLAMTWSSALRYWRGERSRWKGRRYSAGDG